MKIADKLISLRKKNGWSQEDLAERMDVSRQAVSKWESGQSLPDLEKILQLGELFGVSTDYLLKDGQEEPSSEPQDDSIRRISAEEAERYLALRARAAWRIALATLLCILSPITLLLLGALSELSRIPVSEAVACAVGLAVLFLFILVAVAIFVSCGFANSPYEFLDKSVPFLLERGAQEKVREAQLRFRPAYVRGNVLATCLCVISPLPLILSSFSGQELLVAMALPLTMAIAGIGVFLFILVGVRNAGTQKLLKEGDYTPRGKEKTKLQDAVGYVYWSVLTAIFFLWSFLFGAWKVSWTVFAVGGILFPPLMMLCDYISNRKDNQ